MVRRVSRSQLNSMIRQARSKQRQAINKYNNSVRKVNQEINRHNNSVRQQQQKQKRAIDNYNREVRAHNARVRANRQRYNREVTKFNNLVRSSSSSQYLTTTRTFHSSYTQLEAQAEAGNYGDQFNEVLDYAENEAANSAELSSLLVSEQAEETAPEDTELVPNEELLLKLHAIDPGFPDRWKGGLFSLNPRNPDAARHFCTSAREIFSRIFQIKANDEEVVLHNPDCEKTDRGSPTRRAKISFMLNRVGMNDEALVNFIDEDVDNVLSLFHVLNDGTHGSVGKFSLQKLISIKKRSEDGLLFLCKALAI